MELISSKDYGAEKDTELHYVLAREEQALIYMRMTPHFPRSPS